MARTAAERRAARKRKEQQRGRPRSERVGEGDTRRTSIRELVIAGAYAAAEWERERIVAELVGLDPDVDRDDSVALLITGILGTLWENGWQPADIAHVTRRHGPARLARLTLVLIAHEARSVHSDTRAPEEWVAQLAALDLPADPGSALIRGWASTERVGAADAWRDVLRLVAFLGQLGGLPRLMPPPSQWERRGTRRPRASAAAGDPRMLGRIRGLLAKAESTEFPDEAEALTAKAQELMTRYSVDAAMLDAQHGASLADEVVARRVHLENPYPDAKMQLLNAVGVANGVKVIVIESLGIATTVGLPVDVDLVELIFTSLLVQATRAMAATGRAGSRGTRSPSFRRSFLVSYAIRIGERLAEVRDAATEEATAGRGAALVPVLRERSEAVDDVFAQLFPETSVIEARATNLHGWRAGRSAADTADLGSGREQVRG